VIDERTIDRPMFAAGGLRWFPVERSGQSGGGDRTDHRDRDQGDESGQRPDEPEDDADEEYRDEAITGEPFGIGLPAWLWRWRSLLKARRLIVHLTNFLQAWRSP
jgi:hypothetical protein